MGKAEIISFRSDDALAAAVADAWLGAIREAHSAARPFLVALSGGRVTKKLFAHAVERSRQENISFKPVEFFWADERCVPPDNAESNFRLANELLFQPAGVAPLNVHRIRGELDPKTAADIATTDLARVAGNEPLSIPVLDLVLLGMGEDGHVASLFPGDAITGADKSSIFLPVNNSPKPPPDRVSLGHAAIAAAREVWVLASGTGKEAALRESLSATGQTPLAEVIRGRAVTRIFSDIDPA